MGRADDGRRPVILFGAIDRHNFGDLLFPHVASALLPGQDLVCAGLAGRDLRPHGGHRVLALASLALGAGDPPCSLIHVGGEILDCSAWQAAVMLLPPDEARPTVAYLESRPEARRAWVRDRLGSTALAPYVVSRRTHRALTRVVHAGVGGAGLDRADVDLRAEVLADLQAADAVGVRDRCTLGHLAAAGLDARLMPDAAVMVDELFGARIRARADRGEVARARRAFPQGYVAVQFSADFGDDESLTTIAAQLDHVAARHGLGVLLFRAGAAPWHDDAALLDRVATRMQPGSARRFESLDLWDLCALIASSRAYCGSSLHGRIVAAAFALPHLNLRSPAAHGPSKQAAYAATWDEPGQPGEVDPRDLAEGLHSALAVSPERLRHEAARLARLYREGFNALGPVST
ncbi:MAG: hypothetical protein ABT20_14755 [Rubrivivax sp. SCN 70-15]|nr:MAG: hypothetical protein ABT20_14755 [Rubrivivax sp. SCN 70-15]